MANGSTMDLTQGRPIRQILLFSLPRSCIPLWIR